MSACVSPIARGRGGSTKSLLGFQFWWELDPPDGLTAQLVQLPEPLGVHATYLVRDGFVLELMDYSKRQVHTGAERVMDQIGLTHISFSVSDPAGCWRRFAEFGGAVVERTVTEAMAMIRDPDGQLLELLADGWLSALPARP